MIPVIWTVLCLGANWLKRRPQTCQTAIFYVVFVVQLLTNISIIIWCSCQVLIIKFCLFTKIKLLLTTGTCLKPSYASTPANKIVPVICIADTKIDRKWRHQRSLTMDRYLELKERSHLFSFSWVWQNPRFIKRKTILTLLTVHVQHRVNNSTCPNLNWIILSCSIKQVQWREEREKFHS